MLDGLKGYKERVRWPNEVKLAEKENIQHNLCVYIIKRSPRKKRPGKLAKYNGETVETVSNFIFLGSQITAGGDCSHEIKRCLLLGRKVMTNLDSILKSRDITLPTKVQGYGFSSGHVWMWELDCEES